MIFDFRTSCMQENDNEMLLSTRRSLKKYSINPDIYLDISSEFTEQLKSAKNYKYYQVFSQRKNKPQSRGKSKSAKKSLEERLKFNPSALSRYIDSPLIENEMSRDFLETFCHNYTSPSNSNGYGFGFTERMIADIQRREQKQKEFEKAEKNHQISMQPPLSRLEKEHCYNRLYSDAFYRAYKKSSKILEHGFNEYKQFNKNENQANK